MSGAAIRHVVEIGAGDSYSSQLLGADAEMVQLVEPCSILCEDLVRAAQGRGNVVVHNAAVAHVSGRGHLVNMGYASYLCGAAGSFLRLSCEDEAESFWRPLTSEVSLITMAQLEDNRPPVTHLVLTNNGSELSVLHALRARPQIIQTKHYIHNARQGAYYQQVIAWLVGNGYRGGLLESNQHSTFAHILWERS